MNFRYIQIGIICLALALIVYVDDAFAYDYDGEIPQEVLDYRASSEYSNVTRTTINYSDIVDGFGQYDIPKGALDTYQSDVKIVSSYLNNPIHPALLDANNIIYNDIDFFIYTKYIQEYQISIYMNSVDDPIIYKGETSFMAIENFQVPEGAKKIKKIVVLVGPHKYEWENIKIMHKAIDEETIYVSPEMEVTRREMWLKTIQSFIAGLFASVVFAFGFWRVWKNHLEHEIQDVI